MPCVSKTLMEFKLPGLQDALDRIDETALLMTTMVEHLDLIVTLLQEQTRILEEWEK